MRALCLIASIALVVAGPALAAATPSLTSNSRASVVGGGSGGNFDDHTLPSATAPTSLSSAASQTLANGAYAHSSAISAFGEANVYADGFVPLSPDQNFSNSQAQGYAEFIDYIPGDQVGGGNYSLNLLVSGFHTLTNGLISITAASFLNYTVMDTSTNSDVTFGNWNSTDAAPTANILDSFTMATGHGIQLRVMFEADTYTTNNSPSPSGIGYGEYPVVADYSHTLKVYLDGPSPIIGLSGHDYSTPPTSVPEPATWALMLTGLGGMGLVLRCRRAMGGA